MIFIVHTEASSYEDTFVCDTTKDVGMRIEREIFENDWFAIYEHILYLRVAVADGCHNEGWLKTFDSNGGKIIHTLLLPAILLENMYD